MDIEDMKREEQSHRTGHLDQLVAEEEIKKVNGSGGHSMLGVGRR